MAIDILFSFYSIWATCAVLIIHQYAFLTIMMGFYYHIIQQYQPKLDSLIWNYQTTQTKKCHRELIRFVPKVISEHFHYVQIKNVINDELLSQYFYVIFMANLPTSIYLITKVVFEPMLFAEICLTMTPWTAQLIVCITIVILGSIVFKIFNSITPRLYCSQMCIKSNILLKWNILSYYEMIHSDSNPMALRMGTITKLTSSTGFKVRF